MDKPKYQKRITKDTNYQRPTKTYQESLSNQEIKEKLKDYKKISDITKVSIGSHLRYFTVDPKTNDRTFRLGGTLHKFGDNGQYLILSNGTISWSVQINNTIFFQKMNEEEMKDELKKELKKEIETEVMTNNKYADNELVELKDENKSLIKKYKELEKEFKNLSKKNDTLLLQLANIENEIKKEKRKK